MSEFFQTIWNGFTGLVLQILQWIVAGFAGIVSIFCTLVIGIATWLVGLLPNIPSPPQTVQTFVGFTNHVIPLSEAFALLSLLSVFYAAVYAYKLVKLFRGGG
jgi:hypothetical protein